MGVSEVGQMQEQDNPGNIEMKNHVFHGKLGVGTESGIFISSG